MHINELKAAKAAKAAIDVLLTATPKSAVLATLAQSIMLRSQMYQAAGL